MKINVRMRVTETGRLEIPLTCSFSLFSLFEVDFSVDLLLLVSLLILTPITGHCDTENNMGSGGSKAFRPTVLPIRKMGGSQPADGFARPSAASSDKITVTLDVKVTITGTQSQVLVTENAMQRRGLDLANDLWDVDCEFGYQVRRSEETDFTGKYVVTEEIIRPGTFDQEHWDDWDTVSTSSNSQQTSERRSAPPAGSIAAAISTSHRETGVKAVATDIPITPSVSTGPRGAGRRQYDEPDILKVTLLEDEALYQTAYILGRNLAAVISAPTLPDMLNVLMSRTDQYWTYQNAFSPLRASGKDRVIFMKNPGEHTVNIGDYIAVTTDFNLTLQNHWYEEHEAYQGDAFTEFMTAIGRKITVGLQLPDSITHTGGHLIAARLCLIIAPTHVIIRPELDGPARVTVVEVRKRSYKRKAPERARMRSDHQITVNWVITDYKHEQRLGSQGHERIARSASILTTIRWNDPNPDPAIRSSITGRPKWDVTRDSVDYRPAAL